MQCSADPACNCPPITFPPCPPPCPPRVPKDCGSSKYYQEIGAEMMSNQLIIRMEKDKNSKARRRRNQWDPPCDCDMVEIQRPTSKEGPKIINGGNDNRILFRIHSKSHLITRDDPNYKPQAIAYQMGTCDGGKNVDDRCKTITVYPQYGSPACQEVFTDRMTEGDQNVFFLRVKKKPDTVERKKRKIELELRTPRSPTPPPTPCPLVVDAEPDLKPKLSAETRPKRSLKRKPSKQDLKVKRAKTKK